jgi:hypothetical protein
MAAVAGQARAGRCEPVTVADGPAGSGCPVKKRLPRPGLNTDMPFTVFRVIRLETSAHHVDATRCPWCTTLPQRKCTPLA